ncbi:MAG: helix-turn-helix domain-containing protein [Proteobacteria bacterium]|nr:helix-turn-helix domain-containing protein [Pseudomonadota bacterium]
MIEAKPASRQFSPSQVALALGVSESSLKRWCDHGVLKTTKTPGGHRKITLRSVLEYLRASQTELVRPELLGLPAGLHQIAETRCASQALRSGLVRGDGMQVRGIVLGSHLAGTTMTELGDEVIAPAFVELGELWASHKLEVYRERRACELTLRALHEMVGYLPDPQQGAPLAIGGTPEGDVYQLPTTLIELVLRAMGWRAQSLGSGHPGPTLHAALIDVAPRLFWLSVSHVQDAAALAATCRELESAAARLGATFVVGGRGLDEKLRSRLAYTAHCDQLKHLESLARSLWQVA